MSVFGRTSLFSGKGWNPAPVAFAACRRFLRHSGPSGGTAARFRNRRSGGNTYTYNSSSSHVLLDKFVKRVDYDGSIVVRAPFTVKVKGSYFDSEDRVDRAKNRKVTDLYKRRSGEFRALTTSSPTSLADIEEACPPSDLAAASSAKRDEVEKLAKIVSKQLAGRGKDGDDTVDPKPQTKRQKESLIHLLLYGKSVHRIDTYSVVTSDQRQHSYVYLTDASSPLDDVGGSIADQYHYTSFGSGDEVISSPDGMSSTAHFSIWEPNRNDAADNSAFSSAVRMFSPRHVIESHDSGLRAVCLLPTSMSKIYIQADLSSHVDVDGTLIDDLTKVCLSTEVGNIRARDVTADEVTLASRLGDIVVQGVVDGKISAETFGDGDFVAKHGAVYGPSLAVSTEDGDINLWSECRSESVYLSTRRGHVAAKELHAARSTIVLHDVGNVNARVVDGSVAMAVKSGTVYAMVDNIAEDSSIEVEKGDVFVTVPVKCQFRVRVSAPSAEIAPRLLNSGQLSLNKDTGFEEFTNVNPSEVVPTLHVSVVQGTANVIVSAGESERMADYDSIWT